MDDKQIMESILLTTKGACDLYMHGTIESPTANVHQTFSMALNDTLCMQDNIYKQMTGAGSPPPRRPSRRLPRLSRNTRDWRKTPQNSGWPLKSGLPLFFDRLRILFAVKAFKQFGAQALNTRFGSHIASCGKMAIRAATIRKAIKNGVEPEKVFCSGTFVIPDVI